LVFTVDNVGVVFWDTVYMSIVGLWLKLLHQQSDNDNKQCHCRQLYIYTSFPVCHMHSSLSCLGDFTSSLDTRLNVWVCFGFSCYIRSDQTFVIMMIAFEGWTRYTTLLTLMICALSEKKIRSSYKKAQLSLGKADHTDFVRSPASEFQSQRERELSEVRQFHARHVNRTLSQKLLWMLA